VELTEIFFRLRSFIKKQRGSYRFEINQSHSLQKDLGIYGLDAVEFLIDFGNEFNVDVSQFEAEKYFRPDGNYDPRIIYRELTVGMLIESINKGELK